MMNPQNYDWKSMGEIKLLDDDKSGLSAEDLDPALLDEAKGWIWNMGIGFTLLIVVIWPVLSTPAGVFTKDYFAGAGVPLIRSSTGVEEGPRRASRSDRATLRRSGSSSRCSGASSRPSSSSCCRSTSRTTRS